MHEPEAAREHEDFESARRHAEQFFTRCAIEKDRALLAMDADSLKDLLKGDERIPADARAVILPLARQGVAHAKRAIEIRPDDARGYLLLALNVGMIGLAKGKFDAFMAGVPGRVMRAYSKAIALDETCESAGPLQIEGRFRTLVPFPYRNLRRARTALERAASIARVKQTLLFLGDVYWRLNDKSKAIRTWRNALQAPPHPPAKPVAGYVDLLIRRRLELADAD